MHIFEMLKVENHPSQEVKNSNWTQKNCKRNKNLDINMSRTNEIEKNISGNPSQNIVI